MLVQTAISSVCFIVVFCAISAVGKTKIPSTTECGFSTVTPQGLIIGGSPAYDIARWPWMAAIIKNGIMYCGGALITDRHILSAAHCFSNRSSKMIEENTYIIKLGNAYLNDTSIPTQQIRNISKVIVHSFYYKSLGYDIAVVKLSEKVNIKKGSVFPVCLPKEYPDDLPQEEYHFNDAAVAGWGAQYNHKIKPSEVLQEIKVKYNFRKKCKKWRSRRKMVCREKMHQEELCARGSNKKDTCEGDSGGPLVRMMNHKQWKIIGIVARGCFGSSCGKGGIYTRVGEYIDFIKDSITV